MAALFVLMGMLENSSDPKALANTAKRLAFTCCSEIDLYGMVDAQIAVVESKLLARSRLAHLRYEGGVDTLLNALDSDRELFDAELNLTQTKRNELLSLVQLYKALGGGWQQ
jgi:hypothetical protein